ncbi:MAG: hypothetical protein WAT93_03650, partial [Pontixanthobacter sp.]
MRFTSSLRDFAAVLLVALLHFVVWGGGAQAQTITNIARADWSDVTGPRSTLSNLVELEVSRAPTTITTFEHRPTGGSTITYYPSLCGSQSTTSTGGGIGDAISISAAASSQIHVGRDLLFQVNAADANSDPSVIDSLV